MADSVDASVYLYRVSVSAFGQSQSQGGTWYSWAAAALLLAGAMLALAGSIAVSKRRVLLSAGGALGLVSIVLFVVVFQMDFMNVLSSASSSVPGGFSFGLFSSGSFTYENLVSTSYSSYLSFGLWIALAGAILMMVAAARKSPSSTEVTTDPFLSPAPPLAPMELNGAE